GIARDAAGAARLLPGVGEAPAVPSRIRQVTRDFAESLEEEGGGGRRELRPVLGLVDVSADDGGLQEVVRVLLAPLGRPGQRVLLGVPRRDHDGAAGTEALAREGAEGAP